jgi:nitrite reductase (NO-forming)
MAIITKLAPLLFMYTFIVLEMFAWGSGVIAFVVLFEHIIKRKSVQEFLRRKWVLVPLLVMTLSTVAGVLSDRTYAPGFAMPPFMHSMAPGGLPPTLPFANVINFFKNESRFERVADIGRDPNDVPPPITRTAPEEVKINIVVKEVISEIAPGIYFNYWTFNGTVPGPMYRVREGDTVILTITNDPSSLHHHNIDLHSVTGQGGGASLTDVMPGETKTIKWKALNQGLFIYHCAMPNVSTHNSHGQYGLILVEPKEGLPKVDKEFYVVQGELYTQGQLGKKGLTVFDSNALLDGVPNYVTFNGKIEGTPRMHAKVGEKIRMYVGNGGVNLISSFHVIGEIFDTVYPEGSLGEGGAKFKNIQTTAVLPGGSSIVEFTVDVPGKYLLVDHALSRMNKGAWAVLEVTGDKQPDIYSQVPNNYTINATPTVGLQKVENDALLKKEMH